MVLRIVCGAAHRVQPDQRFAQLGRNDLLSVDLRCKLSLNECMTPDRVAIGPLNAGAEERRDSRLKAGIVGTVRTRIIAAIHVLAFRGGKAFFGLLQIQAGSGD